jgi:hypothetical protein
VFEYVAGIHGVTVGEFFVLRRRKKDSRIANDNYMHGGAARIDGCVYGFTPLFMTTWVGGVMDVEPGVVTWYPGFHRAGLGRRIEATDFEPVSIRVPTTRESWAVNLDCAVLVGDLAGHRVEISVLQDDMPIVLDALNATQLLD